MKLRPIIATLIAASCVAVIFFTSRGPSPNGHPTADEVAGRTMSPFCPGLTVQECPSSQAAELRRRIGQKVVQGATNRQIDDWLVSNYGASILAKPKQAVSWLIPLALFLIAGTVLLAKLPAREPLPTNPSEPEGGELHERFEREFSAYREASE
ncbi:MAG: cytochrome c-type biogenesis protein CcmH [Actinomycetota bacterium]|nr:cytochrome c-type biogenesis protein CcmH [Actinomycetota bacterium]